MGKSDSVAEEARTELLVEVTRGKVSIDNG